MCRTKADSASGSVQHAVGNQPLKQDTTCSPPVASQKSYSYRRRRHARRAVAIALLCVLAAVATMACGRDGSRSTCENSDVTGSITDKKRLAELVREDKIKLGRSWHRPMGRLFNKLQGRTRDGRRRKKRNKQKQHPDVETSATSTKKNPEEKSGKVPRRMRKRRALWKFLVRLLGKREGDDGGGSGDGVLKIKGGGKRGAVDELRARLLEDLKKDLDRHPGDLRRRAKAVGIELDDCILMRYLEMAYWTLEWAGQPLVEAIDSTIRWREEARPHLITDHDVMEEAENGKMFVRGHDREGRPIIHYSPGQEKSFDTDKGLSLLFHTLEKAGTMLPSGQTQFAVVADCSDFGPSKTPPLAMIKSAMFTMQQHYPMRLGYVVIVNASGPINLVWKLISSVLHERTKEKIVFLTKREAAERLSRHIDPSNLHLSLPGGLDPFRYSNELYLSKFSKK